MSEFDSDDLEMTGCLLPEDSWLRLKKLHGYVEFLANLARPRTAGERQEWTAEIRLGEVATCLELLSEQIGQVLDEPAWPAERGERMAAPGADAEPDASEADASEPEAVEPLSDKAGRRYLFGVTLDQIDEINLLVSMIRALGDVVIANDDAEFADHTLSTLGSAIFSDAEKLHDIIADVNAQRLGPARSPQTGVEEEQGVYFIGQRRRPVETILLGAWPLAAEKVLARSLAAWGMRPSRFACHGG